MAWRGPASGGGNNPPVADLALAVDIGGTKMAAGLVALDGTLLHRDMQPTPPSAGPDDAESLWDVLAGVVAGVTALVAPVANKMTP